MTTRLEVLSAEFDKVRSAIDELEQKATKENRDLTDAEQKDSDTLLARAAEIKKELDPLIDRKKGLDATADVLARMNLGAKPARVLEAHTAGKAAPLPTAAEYITEYMRSKLEPERFATFREELVRGVGEQYSRAVADTILADIAGIVPTPIVGEMIKLIDDRRPLINSLTPRPMPAAGKNFTRPKLTARTLVAEQAAEMDEVASRKFTIGFDTVTKRTFAGVIELSKQSQDWSDPALLGIVLDDFIGEYGVITEDAIATTFEAAVTATSAGDLSDTQNTLETFAQAAVDVYEASLRFPRTLWLALDRWAQLFALVDAQDRPLFPQLGGGAVDVTTGAFSSTPLGLRVVVAPSLPAGTMILGDAGLAEFYENKRGFLTVEEPSVLATQIAYYGYVAAFVKPEGFTSITAAT